MFATIFPWAPAEWNGRLSLEHGLLNGIPPTRQQSFSALLVFFRRRFRTVSQPMLGRRMVMHFAERPGKIKLFRKSKLIADLLDGELCAVKQLDGALHAQVVEIAHRRVAGHPPK